MSGAQPSVIRRFTGESEVASWATRFDVWDGGESRRRNARWHFVESVVSGDVVTACGKRMPVEGVMPNVPLRFVDHAVKELKCRTCDRIVDRRARRFEPT